MPKSSNIKSAVQLRGKRMCSPGEYDNITTVTCSSYMLLLNFHRLLVVTYLGTGLDIYMSCGYVGFDTFMSVLVDRASKLSMGS